LIFADIFSTRKLEPQAIVWRCWRDPTFIRFSKTQTCDRQTDGRTEGQTDRQTDTRRQLIPALASVARVKTEVVLMPVVNKGKTLALNASAAAAATTAGETRRNWPSAVAGDCAAEVVTFISSLAGATCCYARLTGLISNLSVVAARQPPC